MKSADSFCDGLKSINFNELGYKDGDQVQIEIIEGTDGDEIIISPVEVKELNDLININIPPPPDLKSEYFLDLIENEFEKILKRAKKLIESATNKDKISFYANKNVQIAKRIAVEAHHLSKQLEPEDLDSLDSSNYYIIYILKHFLLRLIIFFQNLFEPYLECNLLTEDEIRILLYEEKSAQQKLKEFEERCAELRKKNKKDTSSNDREKHVDEQEKKSEIYTSECDSQYLFSREGDYWKVKYDGRETLLRDLKRIRYIAHMLNKPNTDFYCRELYSIVNGHIPDADSNYSKMLDKDLKEKEGLRLINLEIEGLDNDEKNKIEDITYDLWSKMNDSSISTNQKNELEKQWDNLKRHFSNDYGIYIKSSKKGPKFKYRARLNKDAEKARINVTLQIRKAIEDIEEKIPKLAKHLRRYIQTGATSPTLSTLMALTTLRAFLFFPSL
jgi:hypothetical protein